jgi:hypothetical protein
VRRLALVAAAVSSCNITIHALIMVALVAIARKGQRSGATMVAERPSCLPLVDAGVDAAPPGTDFMYFAFVNYTTLGYGDVLRVERWRLLGPLTAMNGVLLFGWSTAVIFELMRRTLHRDFEVVTSE